MKNYFTISEFVITGKAIPLEVADKILSNHIPELNKVRSAYDGPVYVSRNSGYRPYRWEINKGRSGDSEHVFRGAGAVDITASDMDVLVSLVQELTSYTRICYYPHHGFIHLDYANEYGRIYYEANKDKEWIQKRTL